MCTAGVHGRALALIKKKAGSQMVLWVYVFYEEVEDRTQRRSLSGQNHKS